MIVCDVGSYCLIRVLEALHLLVGKGVNMLVITLVMACA